ncbi:MAG: hypothetical protein ACRELV_02110 [Longimicrobiales bacterium]
MAEDRLVDARQDARSAIERYDALDRKQKMDAGVLKRHATEIHGALDSLVQETERHYDGGVPGEVEERRSTAREALGEFEDPTIFDHAQHVRRACFVLRQQADSLLGVLERQPD